MKRYTFSKEYLEEAIRKEWTVDRLMADQGCARSTVHYQLHKHKLQIPDYAVREGSIFGQLCVLQKLTGGHNSTYLCRCTCGNTTKVKRCHLRSGNTQSCGCLHRRAGPAHPRFGGVGELSCRYWNNVLLRARTENRELSVTMQDAWDLFLLQNRRCALSNELLSFRVGKGEPGTASLDRIDSSQGYVMGNVQWVHKDVNWMKQDFTQDYFLDLCRQVSTLHPE